METMTIGDVARHARVQTSTVRYYERIGLLPPPKRVSGQRRYGTEILPRLAVIRLGRQAGFRLAEIHDLLYGFAGGTTASERWESTAETKLDEVDAEIAALHRRRELLQTLIECRCATLDQCGVSLKTMDESSGAAATWSTRSTDLWDRRR